MSEEVNKKDMTPENDKSQEVKKDFKGLLDSTKQFLTEL